MATEESDVSLRYFAEAEAALRRNDFAAALTAIEDGLGNTYHSSQPINSKSLLSCLCSFIGVLRLNLQQNFGDEWRIIQKAPTPEMSCSFCGQPKANVSKIIAGPAVNICNECVDICVEIIADAHHQT
jgi:hypothetical protein